MESIQKTIFSVSRRDFLASTGAFLLSSAVPQAYAGDTAEPLGHWFGDEHGLPGYQYTGPMRFPDSPREGSTILLPDGPYFMLGNYRFTLFTHASGLYEILSGESIWVRLNCGDASRLSTAGLSIAMPYCTHAHAWPLYCYLRLVQSKNFKAKGEPSVSR